MAQPANSDTELLTEHFGYPPVSLLDDIINSINILAERALNSVEQGLLNAPPASLGFREHAQSKTKASRSKSKSKTKAQAAPEQAQDEDKPALSFEEAHRLEIENGTHQLETLLCASIDRTFDKFELYVMRNILCVGPGTRDWIRLAHYEGLDFSGVLGEKGVDGGAEGDADRPTVAGVHRLRRRLQASQKLNVMLHAERARNETLLAELRGLVGSGKNSGPGVKTEQPDTLPEGSAASLRFLQNKGDLAEGDAETPLTTTTAFTLSQLQALRALSTSLRNIMPDLEEAEAADPNLGQEDTDGRKTWRRERLEYVESATRKHLENVRGLELGKNGEVRDGEWQSEGRALGKGEVEGLEKVVTIIGRGASADGGHAAQEESMDES
ncbi:hypothetical protein GQ53DRAFT_70376 [Thozetella sp. PMI_491]|nr:hypothetical protein GQ53DRAFT_70376 [Thozetella sp. PMI_491]